MPTTKLFGRDPVLLLTAFAMLVKLVAAFGVGVTPEVQAWVNAVAAAFVGVVLAFKVGDGQVAAILGLMQAVMALAVGLGLHWSTGLQAAVMAAAAAVFAAFTRTQVIAPVPAEPPAALRRNRPTAV